MNVLYLKKHSNNEKRIRLKQTIKVNWYLEFEVEILKMRVFLALVILGCFIEMVVHVSANPKETTTSTPVPPPSSGGSHSDSHSGEGSYSYSYNSREGRCIFFCGGEPGAPGGGSSGGAGGKGGS